MMEAAMLIAPASVPALTETAAATETAVMLPA